MEPDDIYKIDTFHSEGNEVTATVIFNENHSLFAGHFPGNPIVPGVVQVQIIKNLAEKHLGRNLFLTQAKNIKFLSVISPLANPKVEITLLFGAIIVDDYPIQASIRSSSITFMKFSGIYKALMR